MDTVAGDLPVDDEALFDDTDVVPALLAAALLTDEDPLLLASDDVLEVALDVPMVPLEVLLLVPIPRRTAVVFPAKTRSSPTVSWRGP